MSEQRLAAEIRFAFDSTHEPNPGLEHRVIAAVPWEAPVPRRVSGPRLAGAFAGAIAVVTILALVTPTVLSRLNITLPGGTPVQPPYYSLAAVTGDSVFVIQRGPIPTNILLQSHDGGHSWASRLRFASDYDGMQMFGQEGFIWSIADAGTNCSDKRQPTCQPPTFQLTLFRTSDGGVDWTEVKAPSLPANGAYFMDPQHGWIDSGSPFTGLGNDVLYSTVDGGNSWSYVGPLPNSAPMVWVGGAGQYHVTFSSTLRGWYLGNNEIFTTADGGRTWSLVSSDLYRVPGTTTAYSQPAFNGKEGILPVAYRATGGADNATANVIAFFVSHDGGATWIPTPLASPAGFGPVGDILSISVLDTQHFWLTSQSLTGGDNVQAAPAIARTSDGGLTWTVVHHTPRILQMIFRDATHGFAFDVTGQTNVNGILATSDAGASWERVNIPVFA